ncbi:hypothetical protein CH380_03515 [Leptospira adleri]|uniref:Uncharacterized protein n=1 Tax=Leptospira adleri TaxID=2023186 RepID=A0A2M9YTD0_9LEPT|nr:hypothetical protein CH380_03515 [Leptospira adleri]PJZ61454.1 hypothetical protein CH376_13240 [Leptospira adleri]TGM57860.1 hypothetical protein EHQ97_09255 [Leptospira adleri]
MPGSQSLKNSTKDSKSESIFQKLLSATSVNSSPAPDSMLSLQRKITDFQEKAEQLESKINRNRIDLKV